MTGTITGSQAAELLGVADANIARTQLARWGITPLHRAAGRGGQNIYDAAQVRQAIANRPGRGRRTDLKGDHAAMTNTTETEQDRAVARVETAADWIMGAIAACDDTVILNRGNNLGQIEMELPKGRAFLVTVEELDNTE